MKTLIIGTLVAGAAITSGFNPAALGGGASAFVRPSAAELSHLRAQGGGKLAVLRAGAFETQDELSGTERARLSRAQLRNPELSALRAGEVDSVLLTILVVVAIIAIVLIIV